MLTEKGRADREALVTIQRELNLSATEARVALAVSRGLDSQQISNLHGVSVNTVRSQLRSIFGKTGARNKVQLVLLLFRLIGFRG